MGSEAARKAGNSGWEGSEEAGEAKPSGGLEVATARNGGWDRRSSLSLVAATRILRREGKKQWMGSEARTTRSKCWRRPGRDGKKWWMGSEGT
jgi:hypothetical protein